MFNSYNFLLLLSCKGMEWLKGYNTDVFLIHGLCSR